MTPVTKARALGAPCSLEEGFATRTAAGCGRLADYSRDDCLDHGPAYLASRSRAMSFARMRHRRRIEGKAEGAGMMPRGRGALP
jgi:hypothetical protein